MEQFEGTLLGLETGRMKALQGLLAGGHLLAAHDAAALVHDKVGLGQTTRSVLGCAVVDLGLGARGDHGTTAHLHVHVHVVAASVGAAGILAILTRVRIHLLPEEHIFFHSGQGSPCWVGTRKDF